MIPLRDDTPRFSTPYVTYFLIALNTLVWFYEVMLGSQTAFFGAAAKEEVATK